VGEIGPITCTSLVGVLDVDMTGSNSALSLESSVDKCSVCFFNRTQCNSHPWTDETLDSERFSHRKTLPAPLEGSLAPYECAYSKDTEVPDEPAAWTQAVRTSPPPPPCRRPTARLKATSGPGSRARRSLGCHATVPHGRHSRRNRPCPPLRCRSSTVWPGCPPAGTTLRARAATALPLLLQLRLLLRLLLSALAVPKPPPTVVSCTCDAWMRRSSMCCTRVRPTCRWPSSRRSWRRSTGRKPQTASSPSVSRSPAALAVLKGTDMGRARVRPAVLLTQVHGFACAGFKTAFGGGKSTGFGLIYDTEAKAMAAEPNYRLVRNGMKEFSGGGAKSKKEKKNRLKKLRGIAKAKGGQ
jgi:hypothetical protein